MTINTLSLSELRGLSAEDRKSRLAAFEAARHAPLNGEVEYLASCIGEFESRYEMTSANMVSRVRSGAMPETAEIGRWLMLLDAQNSLEQQTR